MDAADPEAFTRAYPPFPSVTTPPSVDELAADLAARVRPEGVELAIDPKHQARLAAQLARARGDGQGRLVRQTVCMELAAQANRQLADRGSPRRWSALLFRGERGLAEAHWHLLTRAELDDAIRRGVVMTVQAQMARGLRSVPLAVIAIALLIVAVNRPTHAWIAAAVLAYAAWFGARMWLRRAG